MISNKVAIAVALWTLLWAPFLCGLGVVVHACIDDAGNDCHHELSCEVDPCQIIFLHMSARDEAGTDDNSPHDTLNWDFGNSTLPITTHVQCTAIEIPIESLPDLLPCTRTLPLIC